ncbi:MAG: hypothetical protein WAK21_10505, partial [Candidatus Sulfotelmatobacter sp.]
CYSTQPGERSAIANQIHWRMRVVGGFEVDLGICQPFSLFSFSFATFKSALICAIVLGLGIDRNCRRKPKEAKQNPIVTNMGRSTLTTATARARSHSGQTAVPRLNP